MTHKQELFVLAWLLQLIIDICCLPLLPPLSPTFWFKTAILHVVNHKLVQILCF